LTLAQFFVAEVDKHFVFLEGTAAVTAELAAMERSHHRAHRI